MPNILYGIVRQFFRQESKLVKNVAWLYSLEAANLLIPLLTVPYLARALGATAWGPVILGQAVAAWVGLIVEFGFGFSATRNIAQGSNRSDEFSSVTAAKLVLAASCLSIAVALTSFGNSASIVLAGTLAGIAQGMAPNWLLNGMQLMRAVVITTVGFKILWSISIFTIVTGPHRASWVVWLLVVANSLTTASLFWQTRKYAKWEIPQWKLVANKLREGTNLFLFSAASGIYSAANVLILGLFSSPIQVSLFGGADSIRKAGLRALVPLGTAIFPRISESLISDRKQANKIAISVAGFGVVVGIILALTFALFAPQIVNTFLGPGFESAAIILQILSLQLPLTAASRALGVQWMLPNRMDRPFRNIVISGSVVNLCLAVLLMPRYGAIGAAWCLVIVEAMILAAFTCCVLKRNEAGNVEPLERFAA